MDPAKKSVYYYHCNPAGLPEDITDSEGNIVWRGRYSTWGKLVYEHTTRYKPQGFTQPLRMQGQYDDSNTGLYYNTFRYYDADAGRYSVEDPIGLKGGMNLYQYAPNPLKWADPLGLELCYGNTATVNGYHQKVYVTSPGVAGGTYGISFGMDRDGQQGSFNASEVGGPGHGVDGSGIVYIDNAPVIKVQKCFTTTAEEDLMIQNDMMTHLDKRGPYSVPGYTCRTYSQEMYDEYVKMVEEHRRKRAGVK